MSPTLSELVRSAASDEEDVEASGARRWNTVVALLLSIAPVAISTAATTATRSPPTAPATKLAARRFIRRDGRSGPLIRRKPRVRREREEPAQASQRPVPIAQRPPQRAAVARGRRLCRPGR